MKLTSYTVNPFQENTYVMARDGKAILFDPGFFNSTEVNLLVQTLKEWDATLIAIVLTHAHTDHVLGLTRVLDRYEVPVYLNHEDLYLWENFVVSSAMFGLEVKPFDFTPIDLQAQKDWKQGPFTFDVLFTPGHAPGHLSFYDKEQKILIAGDTLFQNSIGRTDLYKGDFDTLKKSIRENIYTLPDETRVLPGHGPETTVGYEKKNNQFVKEVK
ncbi:MAG: MBL fold metallo-hydrolase [Balneolales bacterium]